MSRRVLIAGHWLGGEPSRRTALAALEEVGEGFTASAPDWEAELVPFGPGAAFAEALGGPECSRYSPIVLPLRGGATAQAGRMARDALDAGLIPVVEGGHSQDVDCGIGFIGGFTGTELSDSSRLERDLPAAIEKARLLLAGRDMIAAASTRRPLLGMASVLAVDPGLNARQEQDRRATALLARILADADGRSLPLAGDPPAATGGRAPGSGAGGGTAAMIGAIGGRIIDTGRLLRGIIALDERLESTDLVLVLEPDLHSPALADAFLDVLSGAASQRALPVVAIGRDSSLSAHERAEWGLNGQFLTEGRIPLRDAGKRIGRTWGR